ncbi:MAG: hypothetical protein O2816_11975 [Planctomycetota bacterium]|nr:hypothetical protein [Planctomycetota bacterium]
MKLLTLAVFLLGAPVLASDVFVVDHTGGGDFTDLQSAVNAAADGDTLLVKQGTYGTLSIDGKGLTVAADLGHIVSILGGSVVRNTAAGQSVELIRLRHVGGFAGGDLSEHGLVFEDCAGSVRVESCVIKGSNGNQYTSAGDEHGGDGVHISACDDVALMGCTVFGGHSGETWSCSSGLQNRAGHALFAELDSLVTVHQSSFTAGNAKDYTINEIECGGQQAHGAWLRDSRLYGAGTGMTGGMGGSEGLCFLVFPGGDGLRVEGATAHVDLLDMTLTGGPSNACNAPPGQPLRLLGGATSSNWPGPARSMTSESPVRVGAGLPLKFTAPAGETVLLTVSFAPGWQDRIPFSYGPWLGAGPGYVGVVGQMPANGVLNRTWPVGPIPGGLDSEVRYLQALFLGPGQGYLGSPNTVVVLDPQF